MFFECTIGGARVKEGNRASSMNFLNLSASTIYSWVNGIFLGVYTKKYNTLPYFPIVHKRSLAESQEHYKNRTYIVQGLINGQEKMMSYKNF
jgi:hypothetical protein